MRKLMISALVAASFVAVAAPAQAQEISVETHGPCATTFALMEKYNIGLGMHNEELEFVLRTVCGVTG